MLLSAGEWRRVVGHPCAISTLRAGAPLSAARALAAWARPMWRGGSAVGGVLPGAAAGALRGILLGIGTQLLDHHVPDLDL